MKCIVPVVLSNTALIMATCIDTRGPHQNRGFPLGKELLMMTIAPSRHRMVVMPCPEDGIISELCCLILVSNSRRATYGDLRALASSAYRLARRI